MNTMNTTNTTKKHYRVKSRVRFTIFTVVMILLLTCAANLLLGLNEAEALEKETYTTIEVMPGDTLWSIADRYMAADMDPRESVYILCESNQTSADSIYPGQMLQIPDQYMKSI